jgi:hypothetical protein
MPSMLQSIRTRSETSTSYCLPTLISPSSNDQWHSRPQTQSVGGQVVVALAPGNNVGSFHHGVALGCAHANAAKGTEVVAETDNGSTDSLVA